MRSKFRTCFGAFILAAMFTVSVAFAESVGLPEDGTAGGNVVADAAVLDRGRALVRNGKAKEAYDLLKPYESQWAGNPDFDYLYGVAALDSGHPDEAVFSLQRVIAVKPGYPAARMELARAYYEVGDHAASKREFERLQQADPPPFARRVIGNYLTAIEKSAASRGGGGPNHLALHVELGAGFDSNANGATESDQFLGFTLNANNVEQESPFAQLALSLRLNQALSPKVLGYLEGSARQRWNTEAEFVNFSRLQAGGGLNFRDGPVDLSGGLSAFTTYLDSDFPRSGDFNHHGVALDLAGGRMLSPQTRLGAEFRVSPIEYARSQRIRDVTQYVGALNFDHQWNTLGKPRLLLSGLAGLDDEKQTASNFGRDIYGLRSVVGWTVMPKVQASVQAGFLYSGYEGLFFGRKRRDHQMVAGGSLDVANFASPAWSWSPYVLYVRNESKVSLFEYDRTEVGINLRWTPRFNLPSSGGSP